MQPSLNDEPGLLAAVAEQLRPKGARRPVPFALVDLDYDRAVPPGADHDLAPIDVDDVEQLRKVLSRMAGQLGLGNGGNYRFRRFSLVNWLMKIEVPEPDGGTPAISDKMFRRALVKAGEDGTATARFALDHLPGVLATGVLVVVTAFLRILHSGRVPGPGKGYRWFRNQDFLQRGDDSFAELAYRITALQWKSQDPAQIAGLLVGAFLQDLREAYHRRAFRYRTTFPIVLLDGITRSNGGYALIRTVADVRNETRTFDPLLLMTTSRLVPPLAEPPDADSSLGSTDGQTPEELLTGWNERIEAESRRREIVAWIIPITVHVKSATAPTPSSATPAAAPPAPFLTRPPAPWHRTPAGRGVAVLATLALIGGGYSFYGDLDDERRCGDGFQWRDGLTWIGSDPIADSVERIGGTCVGVSDGSNSLLLPSAQFDDVRGLIFAQNERVRELHEQTPQRPLMTLVFVAAVADQVGVDNALAAQREQLAGMAVVQARQLDRERSEEPLLRVLLANAGPQLEHTRFVVDRLRMLMADDPSIVAATGLHESRESTKEMVKQLAAAGIPSIAATLTADSMVETSRLYFQISPQNRREAAVAAAYLDQLMKGGRDPFRRPLTRRARLYKSADPQDTYSQNLAADLEQSLGRRGIPVRTIAIRSNGEGSSEPDAERAGRDACDAKGEAVLYAARGLVDFQAFLDGITDRCPKNPPYILAGDDVTKHVAERKVSAANRAVPYQYLSLAIAPELGGAASPAAANFYQRLKELFRYEDDPERSRTLDGHAALSYDAGYTAVLAVRFLAENDIAVSSATLWPALLSITDEAGQQRRYEGVTGTIDFGGRIEQRVPVNKPVYIVTFRGGKASASDNLVCGDPRDRESSLTKPWCPFD
ncbi:ABC transporter substrate-binding protein [Kribbella flavida]|uniref:ABC transporter substrate-binding protein n=1 Tax=Kribbella flavida TaxID=182640 RepID=UPI0011D191E3|nr:ABC transporter substrate-binding protein [Kribbella flavida]